MKNIGIVGVGGMGGGIAQRLLEQGWNVTLWNRSPSALKELLSQGAAAASSPAEAARQGLVISFVANDQALKVVTDGPEGILAGLPEDGVHLSMSTVSPELIEELTQSHGERLICAPVFGRPAAAAGGLLWIAMAGAPAQRDRIRPLLEDASRAIYEFGDRPVSAIRAKIAGNFLIASAIESMSEAFAMLENASVDPKIFHEMMSDSIFGSVIHQNYGRIILDEAFTPPGFKLWLGGKDVGLACDMARATETALPLGELLQERFRTGVEAGMGDLDWNAISKLIRTSKNSAG